MRIQNDSSVIFQMIVYVRVTRCLHFVRPTSLLHGLKNGLLLIYCHFFCNLRMFPDEPFKLVGKENQKRKYQKH